MHPIDGVHRTVGRHDQVPPSSGGSGRSLRRLSPSLEFSKARQGQQVAASSGIEIARVHIRGQGLRHQGGTGAPGPPPL